MRYLLLLLLVAGCFQSSNEYDNLDFRHGTEGLEVEFDKGLPSKVYEGSYINLVLELRNRGAYDLAQGAGKVYISGHDATAVHFASTEHEVPAIMGKNAYVEEGGYDMITVTETDPVKVPFGDSYEPTLMATSCYPYQTLAVPTVCVVSSPTDILEDDICRPETITMGSQGAPVAVTKVEEEVMQQELNFIITIENVGDGKVVNRESLVKCPYDLTHTDINYVDVTVRMSTGGTATCTPANRIRLVDGKGIIFCRMPVEIETSYTSPLVIQLDYGYTSSVTQRIEIAKPPGTSNPGLPSAPAVPDNNPTGPANPDQPNPNDPDPNNPIVNDRTSDCPCDESSYVPCVCLYVDGQRYNCGGGSPPGYGPVYVTPGTHTYSVYSSSSQMTDCRIRSSSSDNRGTCGSASISEGMEGGDSMAVSVYGYIGGVQKASQNCNIVVSASGD